MILIGYIKHLYPVYHVVKPNYMIVAQIFQKNAYSNTLWLWR